MTDSMKQGKQRDILENTDLQFKLSLLNIFNEQINNQSEVMF